MIDSTDQTRMPWEAPEVTDIDLKSHTQSGSSFFTDESLGYTTARMPPS